MEALILQKNQLGNLRMHTSIYQHNAFVHIHLSLSLISQLYDYDYLYQYMMSHVRTRLLSPNKLLSYHIIEKECEFSFHALLQCINPKLC